MLQPKSVNTPNREVVKDILNYNFYIQLNLWGPLFKVINRGDFTETIISAQEIPEQRPKLVKPYFLDPCPIWVSSQHKK